MVAPSHHLLCLLWCSEHLRSNTLSNQSVPVGLEMDNGSCCNLFVFITNTFLDLEHLPARAEAIAQNNLQPRWPNLRYNDNDEVGVFTQRLCPLFPVPFYANLGRFCPHSCSLLSLGAVFFTVSECAYQEAFLCSNLDPQPRSPISNKLTR